MELLFIFINKSNNEFIQKKGFNFSPNHKFSCKVNGDSVELLHEKKDGIDNSFFYKNNIMNVSAIVGENGSGKTTLLQYLYDMQCYPKAIISNEEYRQMHEDKYDKNKNVLVFNEDNKIIIYHNIEKNLFENKTGFEEKCLSNSNRIKKNEYMEQIENLTIVYLTNSLYTNGYQGYFTHKLLNKINLTPNSISVLSKKFYKKIVNYPEGIINETPYNILQSIIIKNKKITEFQQICDVIYFHFLIANDLTDTYISKMNNRIEVDCIPIKNLIDEEYTDILDFNVNDDDDTIVMSLKNTIKCYMNWTQNVQKDLLNDVCGKLYLNLIFEILYCLKIELAEKEIKEIDQLKSMIEELLSQYKSDNEDEKEMINYYNNAFSEVNKIYLLLNDCEIVKSIVPKSDLAYKHSKVISLSENPLKYKKFCELIDSFTKEKWSFVVKYIVINNLNMSSGERAFQNIFTWLNILPFFNKILERESVSIHKDILILIDEIDLYSHPEWQRKYIKVFIDEIARIFADNRVQIIFTTHSPIVLSDMIKDSTIYLSNIENKCVVDNSEIHKQTFGANIHTLLLDSFFMDNTIGEFARIKIKNCIRIMDKHKQFKQKDISKEEFEKDYINFFKLEKDEDEDIDIDIVKLKINVQSIINSIGEPLIKRKLEEIYSITFPETRKDYELEIAKLQLEKAKLQKVINSKDLDDIEDIMILLNEKIKTLKHKAGYEL